MSPNPKESPVTPERIFDMFDGYRKTAAMKGAIELDLFTAIAEGNTSAEALAKRCQASPRGIRILCDFLVVNGLLQKQDGQHWTLTPDVAVFLNRKSPAYLGGTTRFLNSPELMAHFQDVAGIVRRGGTMTGEEGTVSDQNPIWVDFARAMAPMMMPAAQEIAGMLGDGPGRCKVLDIAAGHGLFGIEIAKRNRSSEIVALDWKPVLEVAKENATNAGVLERYRSLAGSAFDVDFGSDYDVVLLTNFLHHFDRAGCEKLLRKVSAALNSTGRAITLEFVPNEDRVSPPMPAGFALTMLASTKGGDAYTFSEYQKMFAAAGFARTELRDLRTSPERVVIAYKS